jgi:hypothetical protein
MTVSPQNILIEVNKTKMKKPQILFTETDSLVVKYCHPKSDDYLHYSSIITIKASKILPIEMEIKFNGTYPFIAPMPPEEYKFKASSIIELHAKYVNWFRKYGYIIK